MDFVIKIYDDGLEIINSYKVFWDRETINEIYTIKNEYWKRSKFSIYLEWFIHTLCYRLGYQKERAKDVYLEYDKSWFKKLFKK